MRPSIPARAMVLLPGLIVGATFVHPAPAQPPPKPPVGAAAAELRRAVQQQLQDGRVDGALETAQKALIAHAGDPGVLDEFTALFMSLARRCVDSEEFTVAERAARAVQKVRPDHRGADALLRSIERQRAESGQSVREARAWLDVEWHEPAFRAIGRAIALCPARREEWIADCVRAAVGAGDDYYFTKNFHQAFYFYDAALRLGAGRPLPDPGVTARWLQSMAQSLAEDIDRVQYPPDFWKAALGRIARTNVDGPAASPLRAIIRGLVFEDLGDLDRAATEYARIAGSPIVGLEPDLVRRGRDAALQKLRRYYDPTLGGRRAGFWQEQQGSEKQVLATAEFRIHHANPEAARRVATALRFHFDRIAGLLGKKPGEIAWPVPCDVYLHRDRAEFRQASGANGDVQALSIIRRRGDELAEQILHVSLDDPMLLSSTLAHELTHLMVGALTGYRVMPGALAEGVALQAEPACRQAQFVRLFADLKEPRKLDVLLAIGDTHPKSPAFYAEASQLVRVLVAKGGLEPLLRASPERLRKSKDLAALYDFPNRAAIEQAYRGRTTAKKPDSSSPALRGSKD